MHPSHTSSDIGTQLVAHRGFPAQYPENTLIGLQAAVQAGARFLEFDVQLSGDGVPVVVHDSELQRTARVEGSIFAMSYEQIIEIEVNEADRFDNKFNNITIPTLADVCELISNVSEVTAFVEIKRASLREFGYDRVVKPIIDMLKTVHQQCVVISFDAAAIQLARDLGADRIGWVVETWDRQQQERAEKLIPDFLFCDQDILPGDEPLWSGPWQWVLYETSDPQRALSLFEKGADLVETDAIGDMLRVLSPS